MKIGQLIIPRIAATGQIPIPFYPPSAGIIVGIEDSLNWDNDEQTPLEKREKYIVFIDNSVIEFSGVLLREAYVPW